MSTGTSSGLDQGLFDKLRATIESRMTLAREASRNRWGDGYTPTGEHWQWECSNCDTPIPITPVTVMDESLECPNCEWVSVDIRSLERYPGHRGDDTLPHLVTHSAEEITPAVGAHIIAHDPASVLRRLRIDLTLLNSYTVLPPVRSTEGLSGRALEEAIASHFVRSTFEIFINWMAEAYGLVNYDVG